MKLYVGNPAYQTYLRHVPLRHVIYSSTMLHDSMTIFQDYMQYFQIAIARFDMRIHIMESRSYNMCDDKFVSHTNYRMEAFLQDYLDNYSLCVELLG